jgi:hypothetical protein
MRLEKEDVNMNAMNGGRPDFPIRDECYGTNPEDWKICYEIISTPVPNIRGILWYYGTSGNQPDEGATKVFEKHYNLQSKSISVNQFFF